MCTTNTCSLLESIQSHVSKNKRNRLLNGERSQVPLQVASAPRIGAVKTYMHEDSETNPS